MNASQRPKLEPLERRILELMANGLDSVAIAERLDVPIDQVRQYVRFVIAKLGARSKLEAIMIALREGFVAPSRMAESIAVAAVLAASWA
jgi:DNA-binding NarL/FixJ family response regulator